MKCWILFESNQFVSKTYEECYANLNQLIGTGIENISDYKFVECNCADDEIMYYNEKNELKCCKIDKDVDKKIKEQYIKRFKIENKEPVDLEKENKDLKTELNAIKKLLAKNNIV